MNDGDDPGSYFLNDFSSGKAILKETEDIFYG